ncbi:hypothetical protein BDU57DRAFT_518040 [Ampelomyces quisqualis]|uniref:Uncharacterized protein n=1 Tax=Ampelomyces quisqualis TaxID=50730 RepID=A0A6A5QKH1_AMPQU|nr:hypothetical protein BDU57DRAFT_518040 [Ampelomyces quisqualis]
MEPSPPLVFKISMRLAVLSPLATCRPDPDSHSGPANKMLSPPFVASPVPYPAQIQIAMRLVQCPPTWSLNHTRREATNLFPPHVRSFNRKPSSPNVTIGAPSRTRDESSLQPITERGSEVSP